MPSNPVYEAREALVRDVDYGTMEAIRRSLAAFEEAIREQERSRYEGLLAAVNEWRAARAATERGSSLPNDQYWVLEDRYTRAMAALATIAAALTPSAPATPTAVWLVEKDEHSRTGQHLWSMWHLDGRVEWTPDANLADQYETQAEAGMAALRITEAKGTPCRATEHVFIDGPATPSAPAEETQTADWIVRQVADAQEAIRTGPKWLQNAAAEHAARRAPAEKEG